MRKLKLNKSKIAIITNFNSIIGGADNSNIFTICGETGPVSETCETDCNCHNLSGLIPGCIITTPGTTRPNTGIKLSAICPDIDSNP